MNKTFLLVMVLAAWAVVSSGVPVWASETDRRIETSFQNSYVYKVFLQNENITIHALEGDVTLTGDVADETLTPIAQLIAEALPGVESVDNQLLTRAELATANADAWIVRKVKLTLMFHRNVNAGATAVESADGIVTLRGDVASQAQKDLTAEYAADVEGVTRVVNELALAETPETTGQTLGGIIDDASITAQVRMALLTHRSTSVLSTRVSTSEGVVTVGGIAQSGAEKDLVSRLVNDIYGVERVVNHMTVEKVVLQD